MKTKIIRFVVTVAILGILIASLTFGGVPTEPGSVEMFVIMIGHLVMSAAVIFTYVVSEINRTNLEVSEINLRVIGGRAPQNGSPRYADF